MTTVILTVLATMVALYISLIVNIHLDRQNAIGVKVKGETLIALVSMFFPVAVCLIGLAIL